MASIVGCETDNVENMMDCLRKAPAENITAALDDLSNWEFTMPMAFVPTVDGEFVTQKPADTLDIKQEGGAKLRDLFSSFDFMIGVTSGEGGAAVHPLTGADTDAENFLPNKTFFAETLVKLVADSKYGADAPRAIVDIIDAEYTDWSDPENPQTIRQQFCEMYRDSTIVADVHRTVTAHASMSDSKTFMYYFNVLLYKSIMTRPSWVKEALHGDDLVLMFGNKIDMEIPGMIEKRDLLDWEKKEAENMMTLWTNFAATGNPNKPRDIGVDWLPYTPTRHRYLEMVNKMTSSPMKERLFERRAELWDRILPAIAKLGKCDEPKKNDDSTGTCSKQGDCPP